jgi:hypothetical protein
MRAKGKPKEMGERQAMPLASTTAVV